MVNPPSLMERGYDVKFRGIELNNGNGYVISICCSCFLIRRELFVNDF